MDTDTHTHTELLLSAQTAKPGHSNLKGPGPGAEEIHAADSMLTRAVSVIPTPVTQVLRAWSLTAQSGVKSEPRELRAQSKD